MKSFIEKIWLKVLEKLTEARARLSEPHQIPKTHIGRWHQLIAGLKYDSAHFYDSLEKRLQAEKLPETKVYRILLKDRGELSDRRLFLRVTRRESVFDIYGGPFGQNNFFISYWHGWSRFMGIKGIFSRILLITPFLGYFYERYLEPGTYYHSDMVEMFQEKIHEVVMHTISEINNANDLSPLTPEEQIPKRKRLDSFS